MVCKYIEINTKQEYEKFKLLTSYLNFKKVPNRDVPCYFFLYYRNKENFYCNNKTITYASEKPKLNKISKFSNELITEITLEELEKIDKSDLF